MQRPTVCSRLEGETLHQALDLSVRLFVRPLPHARWRSAGEQPENVRQAVDVVLVLVRQDDICDGLVLAEDGAEETQPRGLALAGIDEQVW